MATKTRKTGSGKRYRKRRSRGGSWAKAFLLTLLILVLGSGLVAVVFVGGIIAKAEKIDPSDIYTQIDRNSYLYDKDGELIETLYYTENREIIKYDAFPENLTNAFVAIEDKTFWTHHGFNFKRMLGAIIGKLTGRADAISGTSTITQQLARNVYLSDIKSQRTISRKITEMYYAYKIERALTKKEILEAYLNTIYLGYGCYGVDSAARTYFNKDVSELDLAECAALAALPQAPDTYALLSDDGEEEDKLDDFDLYANDASKERRDLTLALMKEQGYISEDEEKSANVNIKDILNPHFEKRNSKYTYFIDYVVSEVSKDLAHELAISEEEAAHMVYTGGLNIYSTIDPVAQSVILTEFEDDYNFPNAEGGEPVQAAMVITEVDTGNVVAMVGGRGQPRGAQLFNRATSPRQPGSSIKPLSVYSAALQRSFDYAAQGQPYPFQDFGYDRQGSKWWGNYITAGSYVLDERMTVNGETWPYNDSRTFSGGNTVRSALEKSLNTCAVKIQLQVGTDFSLEMLRRYGISTVQGDLTQGVNDANPAALGLGAMTYGTTPLDMASAYATFPAGGVRKSPSCYTRVESSEGKTLLENKVEKTTVLDEGVAWIMTDMLQGVVSHGIAGAASLPGVQSGGKTGTTNDAFDIWFCGFTPKYSAALWIGTDKNKEMYTRSATAAALWSRVMRQVPGYADGEYAMQPNDVVYSGGEYYTSGTEGGARSVRGSSSRTSDSGSQGRASGISGESSSREDFVDRFLGGGG